MRNENAPFVALVTFVSLLALAIFAFGIYAGSGVTAIGFVLIFTALVGWTSYIGIRSGNVRRPVEDSRDAAPAEKSNCATTLSA